MFSAAAAGPRGVPRAVAVAVAALVLRVGGLVAGLHAPGAWLSKRSGRRAALPLAAATSGLRVLGVLKCLPWVGIWTWSVATFIGVGAALSTKLGRREAWFEPAPRRSSLAA